MEPTSQLEQVKAAVLKAQELMEQNEEMMEKVLVMGASGAGKSAFICYLNGAQLQSTQVKNKHHLHCKSTG